MDLSESTHNTMPTQDFGGEEGEFEGHHETNFSTQEHLSTQALVIEESTFGSNLRLIVLLVYLFGLVGGLVGMIFEKKSRYIVFNSYQSFMTSMIGLVLIFMFFWFRPLSIVFSVLYIVWIVFAIFSVLRKFPHLFEIRVLSKLAHNYTNNRIVAVSPHNMNQL